MNPTVVLTDMGRLGWSDPAKAKPMLDTIPLGRFAGKMFFNVYETFQHVSLLTNDYFQTKTFPRIVHNLFKQWEIYVLTHYHGYNYSLNNCLSFFYLLCLLNNLYLDQCQNCTSLVKPN